MQRSPADRCYLEEALTLFEPAERLPSLVSHVRGLYLRRHLLKQLPFDDGSIAHLALLVRAALERSERFRVLDCLKVLRAIIVKGDGGRLSPSTVRELFAIYRMLILSAREEMQWCLSRLIKGQELDEADLGWLLSNWDQSEQVVNRLLLYPAPHPLIQTWVRERCARGELIDRQSELLARLLDVDDLGAFSEEDPETVGWAVLRSRRPIESKVNLLSALVPRLQSEVVVEFAMRLDAPELIHRALGEVQANQPAAPDGGTG